MTAAPSRRRGNARMQARPFPRCAIVRAARNPSRGTPPLTEPGQHRIRHLSGEGQGWREPHPGVSGQSAAGYFLGSGQVIPGRRSPGSDPAIKAVAGGLPAVPKDCPDSDHTPPTPECVVRVQSNGTAGRQGRQTVRNKKTEGENKQKNKEKSKEKNKKETKRDESKKQTRGTEEKHKEQTEEKDNQW
jgi:hypothetical protein